MFFFNMYLGFNVDVQMHLEAETQSEIVEVAAEEREEERV